MTSTSPMLISSIYYQREVYILNCVEEVHAQNDTEAFGQKGNKIYRVTTTSSPVPILAGDTSAPLTLISDTQRGL